jgi:hypothetical protein
MLLVAYIHRIVIFLNLIIDDLLELLAYIRTVLIIL